MTVIYREPWWEMDESDHREGIQRQYDLEIGPLHPLWNVGGRVVGKHGGNDDVLVALPDGRYAIVHLTWTSNQGGATWPDTAFYETAEAVSESIARDHDDFL